MNKGKYELIVVMPVYNEEQCIADVLRSWKRALLNLNISFIITVLNDGSKDNTAVVLQQFSADKCFDIINKKNSGHGPTILQGYHKAVELGSWVFQCDSDNEMKPDHFQKLWASRNKYDVLFGYRQGRAQNIARNFISVCSRITIRTLFSSGVYDVNTPYRLIRADILKKIINQIPPDTFAPNLIISGTLAKSGARIANIPVPHQQRRTGTVSIAKWRLWKSALKSCWQTICCRPKIDI